MHPEKGYFYVSEDDLNHRSYDSEFQGKPLAWVYYKLLVERGFWPYLDTHRMINFYNRYSDKYGSFEILFSDHSSFVFCTPIGSGAARVIQPGTGYFEYIDSDYSIGLPPVN